MPEPTADARAVEAAGLAHVLRGLHFLERGHAPAAIPHLRLALLYDPGSTFLYDKLARAWLAAGNEGRANEALAAGLEKRPADPYLNALRGSLAMDARRFDDALGALSIAAADPATVTDSGPRLVHALAWLGQPEQARTRAAEILATAPSNTELALGVGDALEVHGELGAALAAYDVAGAQRPAAREIALAATRILDLQGRTAEAAARLVALAPYFPDDLALHLSIWRYYRRAGDRSAAASHSSEALRLAADDPLARAAVATTFAMEGDEPAALALLRTAAEDKPSSSVVRVMLAETLQRVAGPRSCVEALGNETGDERAAALRLRASCLAAQGRLDEATRDLGGALAGGASPREVLVDAARILGRFASPREARRLFAEVLARTAPSETSIDALLGRLTLAEFVGDERELAQLASEAIRLAPADFEVQMRWADVLYRVGRVDEAIEVLRALLAEAPDDPIRQNALGYTLADAERSLAEAGVLIRSAYRRGADEGFVMDSLGWLYFRLGELDAAARLLRRASWATPGDPEVLMHLAEVLAKTGSRAAAREAYTSALAARPSAAIRRRIEERLRAL